MNFVTVVSLNMFIMFSMLVTPVYTFVLIAGKFLPRQFAIDNHVHNKHRMCIYDALEYYNSYKDLHQFKLIMVEKDEECLDCNQIGYTFDNSSDFGYSHIHGVFSSGDWFIYRTDIFIRREIEDPIICFNVVLHELLHCAGLFHNNVHGSIMNKSIKVNQLGVAVKAPKWKLSLDDLNGLYTSSLRIVV